MSGTDSHGGSEQYPEGGGAPGQPGSPQSGQSGQPSPQSWPGASPSGPQGGQPGQPGHPGQQGGQPGGYGASAPGGYGSPAPAYGQPQGGSYPPPPAGGPGQPGYGYGQPPSGPPSGGSGSSKLLWIVIAAIAGFLVLAIIVVVALVAAGGDDESSTGGTASASKSTDQTQAVEGYLTALSKGDAKKALSYASTQPLSKDFLTDEVLAESAKLAPISDIQVAKPESEYSSTVQASYTLGDQTIQEDFSVTKTGDTWRLRQAGSELDFTRMRKNTLPLLIDGKQLETDKVVLFPGTYSMTTGNDNISYGEAGRLTVKSNSDYLSSSDLEPTLTTAGQKAYVAAVRESVRGCLAKKELQPRNCPNRVTSRTYKIQNGTIKWTRTGSDAFANLKPRLDFENPNVATSRPDLKLQVTANCNAPSGRCTATTYSFSEATVDMTKDQLVVRWATS